MWFFFGLMFNLASCVKYLFWTFLNFDRLAFNTDKVRNISVFMYGMFNQCIIIFICNGVWSFFFHMFRRLVICILIFLLFLHASKVASRRKLKLTVDLNVWSWITVSERRWKSGQNWGLTEIKTYFSSSLCFPMYNKKYILKKGHLCKIFEILNG